MYGLSRAEILGNLTRPPEIRYTPAGKGVAKFSVAVNNVYTKATGEKVDDTFFIDIEAWEKLCEVVKNWKQGDPVYVTGTLKQEKWAGKNGEKRSKLVIKAQAVRNLSRRPAEGVPAAAATPTAAPVAKAPAPKAPAPKAEPKPAPAQPPVDPAEEDFSLNPEDEIPF